MKRLNVSVDRLLTAVFGPRRAAPEQRTSDVLPAPHSPRERSAIDVQKLRDLAQQKERKSSR